MDASRDKTTFTFPFGLQNVDPSKDQGRAVWADAIEGLYAKLAGLIDVRNLNAPTQQAVTPAGVSNSALGAHGRAQATSAWSGAPSRSESWVAFRPDEIATSWATAVNRTGRRRREGSDLLFDVRLELTGAPAGDLTLDVWSGLGLSVDNDRLVLDSGNATFMGGCQAFQGGSGWYVGFFQYVAGDLIYPHAGAPPFVEIDAATPFAFAAGDEVRVQGSLPIVGWS